MDNDDPNETRFKHIEGKLRLLIVLSIVQSLVIAFLIVCLFVKQFMPSTSSVILLLVAIAVFLYVFRNQVPTWIGNASRFVFSRLFDAQKTESMKDIK
jgi:hypothetical protein